MDGILNVAENSPHEVLSVGEIPAKPVRRRGRMTDEQKREFEESVSDWENQYGGMERPAGVNLKLPDAQIRGPKSKAAPKKNVEGIRKILLSLHLRGALLIGEPDLALDEAEAHNLAEAIASVADYYKIKLDGKRGAWLALGYAVSLIYGPRAFALFVKFKAQRFENTNAVAT